MTTTPTSWPNIKAYREALHYPELCFADADLRGADIQKAPGGYPFLVAGASAVVCRATTPAGTIAIRCFTRAASDLELRYRTLQAHIGDTPPPYLVRFAYRDQEIWVDNGRYPLVEMDWVDGRSLDKWVVAHVGRGRDLIDQAAAWLFMAGDMLSRGLAHGDIANDNCLLSGSQLKLIDYDGCYLPGLADSHPGEGGAPHFRHPRRGGYYADDMDAFPSLVVFLSLLALQSDPSLWNRFYDRTNLIFKDPDFEDPGRTPIWAVLAASKDPWVRTLSADLADMCRSPVDGLPSLPQVAQRAGIRLSDAPPWTLLREDADPWYRQGELTELVKGRSGLRARPIRPAVPAEPVEPAAPGPPVKPTARPPARPGAKPTTPSAKPGAWPTTPSTKPSARPATPATRPVTPTSQSRPSPHPPTPSQRHPAASGFLIVLAVVIALIVIGLVA